MLSNPKAVEAIRKEWSGLHKQNVFDMKNVREHDDVRAEARRLQEVVHFARAHGITVEKNDQLPADNPQTKFKYRVVLLGNQVKDQDMADAIFHDLGNSLATFEASRWADFGVLKDGRFKLPTLSKLTSRLALKVLPCGWSSQGGWPEDGSWDKFRRPCVRMEKALYGGHFGRTLPKGQ